MQTQYRLNTKKPHLLCLIILISFPSVSVVLLSPALPAISDYFAISNSYAQQLITLAIIGYALGQLIYSPFANRYGRKVALYLGLSLYVFSCLLCLLGIYLHSLPIILIGRLLMTLGASVGMIISFTVINDFYHPHQARSVVSYTVLAYALMPAFAILLGGFITTHLSWISCFYFYLLYSLAATVAAWRLPETLIKKDLQALKPKPLISGYKQAFCNGRIILFSIIYGLMTAFIYVTASGAPFIGIDTIGLTPAVYGLVLLFPYCGQIIGSLTGGKINNKYSEYSVLALAYIAVIIGSVLMLVFFAAGKVNIFSLVTPIFIIMIGLPISYSVATVKALAEFDDKATGSAVMSFITMTIALLASLALSVLPTSNPVMLPAVYVGLAFVASIIFAVVYKRYPN
ncbi:MAG: MFS transporter [Coxiellaceae bacterium]|nr:MFS transporter [Coxiellaceae bacterium]